MAPAPSLQEVIVLVEDETEDTNPLSRLRAASSLVRNLADVGDAALGYFVDQARHAGHSWSEIGEALGVTKQAAQQKHTIRFSPNLNTPTFERFTPRARNVVKQAQSIAREWGHDYIGTEHILLSLYREPEGLAAQILVESGLPQDKATGAVEERTARGPHEPDGDLSFTPPAKAVFIGALAAASELGHNYIGTEHLLLGLDREDGVAREVLEEAALSSDVLRQRVTQKLEQYVHGRQARQPSAKKRVAKAAPAKRVFKKASKGVK